MDPTQSTEPRVVAWGAMPAYAGLIAHLGIPTVEAIGSGDFALLESDRGLELRPPGEADRPGIRAIFPPDAHAAPNGKPAPLVKAFGRKIDAVLDLTIGLGSDAYRLAAAGYRVSGWERHPAIFALLTSGWGLSVAEGRVPKEIVDRLSFQLGEAEDAVASFSGPRLAAYFDPMYPPPKRSSALPKRPLQILRDLLGSEVEPVEVAATAREKLSRVVVKRPHHAPPILPGASFEVETKLVRFDVYLNPARMEGGAA